MYSRVPYGDRGWRECGVWCVVRKDVGESWAATRCRGDRPNRVRVPPTHPQRRHITGDNRVTAVTGLTVSRLHQLPYQWLGERKKGEGEEEEEAKTVLPVPVQRTSTILTNIISHLSNKFPINVIIPQRHRKRHRQI